MITSVVNSSIEIPKYFSQFWTSSLSTHAANFLSFNFFFTDENSKSESHVGLIRATVTTKLANSSTEIRYLRSRESTATQVLIV